MHKKHICSRHRCVPMQHLLQVLKCSNWVSGLGWGWGSQTPEKTTHPQVIISVQFSDLAGPQPGEVGTMEVLA